MPRKKEAIYLIPRYNSSRVAKSKATAKVKEQLENESDPHHVLAESPEPEHFKDTSPILTLPTELLIKIGLLLPSVKDAIYMSSACRDLKTALGSKNKFFWYQWGIGKAPQKSFKTYHSNFDYQKCLVGMLSGKLAKMCCQVCFTTKRVKYHRGFGVKTCDECFRKNTVFFSDIQFIPNIHLYSFGSERIEHIGMIPTSYKASENMGSPLENAPGTHTYCISRKLAWIPHVYRKIEAANPGKTMEQSVEKTRGAQKAHEKKVERHFDEECSRLLQAACLKSRLGREAFADLILNQYITDEKTAADRKEAFWKRSKAHIKSRAKDYIDARLWQEMNTAMDEKELPKPVTQEWLDKAAAYISRDLFTIHGKYFFGHRAWPGWG